MTCVVGLLFTLNIPVSATAPSDSSSEFNITVKNDADLPISSAMVYLYDFQKDEIVVSGITDNTGHCEFSYAPIANDEENMQPFYVDFLLYVQKDGFAPQPYNLTKYYGEDSENDTDYDITMREDASYMMPQVAKIAHTDGNFTEMEPFTVVRGKEIVKAQTRSSTPVEGFSNHDIPLGDFHANQDSSLKVTFTSSDSLKVEGGFSFEGVFDVSGSRTRKFTSTTTFPEFSPTLGQKIAYSTRGRFETFYTTDSFSGQVYWYHVLDTLSGGTVIGSKSSCTSCNGNWNTIMNGSGNAVPVVSGGAWTLEEFCGNSIELGTKISLKNYGFNGSVGVTRITGASTKLEYTPKNGKDILIYDKDGSQEVWHVTSK